MAPKAKASPSKKAAKGVEKKEAKPKKEKKEKDPNAPKRPLSAYMLYVNANREKIKADNPTATFGEIGKIAGALWKELDEKEKEVFEGKYAKDKERYEKEVKAYKAK